MDYLNILNLQFLFLLNKSVSQCFKWDCEIKKKNISCLQNSKHKLRF